MKSFKQTINEDIQPGYAPAEVTFGGYTTKNLHHSEDAVKSFMSTIDKVKRGEIKDKEGVLHALKATDAYMKINDVHLEQGKAPDDAELESWKAAHEEARLHLHKIGEFMHHMDYWHMHEHEIQDMETKYNPETAGAEMADSYEPQGELVEDFTKMSTPDLKKWINTRQRNAMGGNLSKERRDQHDQAQAELKKRNVQEAEDPKKGSKDSNNQASDYYRKHADTWFKAYINAIKNAKPTDGSKDQSTVKEELTDKTIRAGDKIKVARVVADMLGVENAESMSPDVAVNTGLRKIRTKRMTPDLIGVLRKMLDLAKSVGIKVDDTMVPKALKEEPQINPDKDDNGGRSILRMKDYLKLKAYSEMGAKNVNVIDPTEVGHTLHPIENDDQLRRRKAMYKTEEVQSEQTIDFDTEAQKEKADKVTDKAELVLKHAREREAMAARHHNQKMALKKEEVELDESDGWIGNQTKWKETVQQSHGSDVTFRKYNHPGEPGKRSTEAFNAKGKQVGVYQHHNKMGMVQPNLNKEEVQLDELDTNTLKSYYNKARFDALRNGETKQRIKGVRRATQKLQDKGVNPYTKYTEEAEQIEELSDTLMTSYKDRAEKVVQDTAPYAKKGEYKDIAKNIIKRKLKGISTAKRKLGEESVEEDEIKTADYKTDKAGRKYRAHEIQVEEADGEEFDLSDDDLENMASSVDHEDDILDEYDEDELSIVDQDTGEEVEDDEEVNEEALNEVLSRIERMKAKIRFMRTKAKRTRRLQIVLKRRSDMKTITKRARRLAIKMIKQRLTKKPLSQLTVAEKERVERMIETRKALIDRLAMRLVPRIRKIESDRLSHQKSTATPGVGT